MKYILGVLGAIVLLVIAAVLITTTSNRTGEVQEGVRRVRLADFVNTDATVSWTEQGELVGDDQHKEIRITVSRGERRAEVLTGYSQTIERSQSFVNTQEAFDRFMRSLNESGFARQRKTQLTDYRGACPVGKRYIYTLNQGGNDDLFLWSTSCSREDGTFGGRPSMVKRLFQNQITDYDDFAHGVKL